MQQFLRADGRPLRGDTLQQLAQLFQNILAGDPFALEDGLRLRHLLPGGDISATGCGRLLHMSDDVSMALAEEIARTNRFTVDLARTLLYGTCESCLASGKAGADHE